MQFIVLMAVLRLFYVNCASRHNKGSWGSRKQFEVFWELLGSFSRIFRSQAGSHVSIRWRPGFPEWRKDKNSPTHLVQIYTPIWGPHDHGWGLCGQHAAAWPARKAMRPPCTCISSQGFPDFVGLFSSCPMWPPCACTRAQMTGNYKRMKLGLEKGSLAAIRLHTLSFPNLIKRKLFCARIEGRGRSNSKGYIWSFDRKEIKAYIVFWGFLVSGTSTIQEAFFTIISLRIGSFTMSLHCPYIDFVIFFHPKATRFWWILGRKLCMDNYLLY